MKKLYPILLIVILAALAVGVIYWRDQNQPALSIEQPIADAQNQATQPASNTAPVSTEDWETYSKEHKFTFEFPSQWTSSFQDNVFYASGTDGASITVRLNNELPFGEMEEPKKKAITIGGVKTELLSWSEGEYYFDLENPRNKELVQIFYSYGNSNINYGEFFDEILSSIQFPAN